MTDEVQLDGATPPQRSDDLSFEDAVKEGESAEAKESREDGEPKPGA